MSDRPGEETDASLPVWVRLLLALITAFPELAAWFAGIFGGDDPHPEVTVSVKRLVLETLPDKVAIRAEAERRAKERAP